MRAPRPSKPKLSVSPGARSPSRTCLQQEGNAGRVESFTPVLHHISAMRRWRAGRIARSVRRDLRPARVRRTNERHDEHGIE